MRPHQLISLQNVIIPWMCAGALPGGSRPYSGAGRQRVVQRLLRNVFIWTKSPCWLKNHWWISSGGVQEEHRAGIREFLLLRWNPDRNKPSGFLLLLHCLRYSTAQWEVRAQKSSKLCSEGPKWHAGVWEWLLATRRHRRHLTVKGWSEVAKMRIQILPERQVSWLCPFFSFSVCAKLLKRKKKPEHLPISTLSIFNKKNHKNKGDRLGCDLWIPSCPLAVSSVVALWLPCSVGRQETHPHVQAWHGISWPTSALSRSWSCPGPVLVLGLLSPLCCAFCYRYPEPECGDGCSAWEWELAHSAGT